MSACNEKKKERRNNRGMCAVGKFKATRYFLKHSNIKGILATDHYGSKSSANSASLRWKSSGPLIPVHGQGAVLFLANGSINVIGVKLSLSPEAGIDQVKVLYIEHPVRCETDVSRR